MSLTAQDITITTAEDITERNYGSGNLKLVIDNTQHPESGSSGIADNSHIRLAGNIFKMIPFVW